MSSSRSVLRKPRAKPRADGSLAELAYQLILDQILRGTLPLGAVVPRRSLAQQFGMSFIPVTAAMQRLERDGLLESRPRAGTRVKIPTVEETRDRFDIREALECQSARLCAERSTILDHLDLKRSAEQMDILFNRASSDGADKDLKFTVHKFHTELHAKIAFYARSEALRAAIENSHVLVFTWLYNTAIRQDLPERFHLQLIEAIISGDPEVAEKAMREHVRFGTGNILRAVAPESNDRWRVRR